MSNNLVSVITPTGGRPDAFKICQKYLYRQTYTGPIQWIIIDDCEPRTELMDRASIPGNITPEYYPGPKLWRPGINTQRPNMDFALSKAQGEFIFVHEDDDFYSARYIETMLYFLQRFDAVGEANNRYYALVDRSYIWFNNTNHASLCSTAIRRCLLPKLEEAINSGENPFFDTSFWNRVRNEHLNGMMVLNTRMNVGMKQLPGRTGIGAGHHNTKAQGFTRDPQFEMLKNWVGEEDAQDYIKLATGQPI